ncbi:MAG: aminotransferase class V-fold PLP-dependent enzyme [Flavobacteriaceae bacterium]
MLSNQSHLFSLPTDVTYLNGAYMAPLSNAVAEIGQKALLQKQNPTKIFGDDFFEPTKKLKQIFAKLIDVKEAEQIAIIPSVSYGLATVANNISLKADDEILVLQEQFPSNIYIWQKLTDKYKAKIITVKAPDLKANRGQEWNKRILNSITAKTAVVAVPHVHWADGTLFDLKAIRKKTKENDALLIIDGTQSVGALPFSVEKIQPDALVCAGYKWLMGAYGLGVAYYSEKFNDGNPIEENWINRYNSQDFADLVNYESRYQSGAGRYNMGEVSNFVYTPMLTAAIEQILKWQPQNIQDYCQEISREAIDNLRDLGCFIEEADYRAKHLFGIYLPDTIDVDKLKARFNVQKIYVSFRGKAIRVAPNVYNTKADFDRFVSCFK